MESPPRGGRKNACPRFARHGKSERNSRNRDAFCRNESNRNDGKAAGREAHCFEKGVRRRENPPILTDNPRKKPKKVCTYFLRNSCKFGDACKDVHPDVNANSAAISILENKNASGSSFRVSDDFNSTEMCFELKNYGTCSKGRHCKYFHFQPNSMAGSILGRPYSNNSPYNDRVFQSREKQRSLLPLSAENRERPSQNMENGSSSMPTNFAPESVQFELLQGFKSPEKAKDNNLESMADKRELSKIVIKNFAKESVAALGNIPAMETTMKQLFEIVKLNLSDFKDKELSLEARKLEFEDSMKKHESAKKVLRENLQELSESLQTATLENPNFAQQIPRNLPSIIASLLAEETPETKPDSRNFPGNSTLHGTGKGSEENVAMAGPETSSVGNEAEKVPEIHESCLPTYSNGETTRNAGEMAAVLSCSVAGASLSPHLVPNGEGSFPEGPRDKRSLRRAFVKQEPLDFGCSEQRDVWTESAVGTIPETEDMERERPFNYSQNLAFRELRSSSMAAGLSGVDRELRRKRREEFSLERTLGKDAPELLKSLRENGVLDSFETAGELSLDVEDVSAPGGLVLSGAFLDLESVLTKIFSEGSDKPIKPASNPVGAMAASSRVERYSVDSLAALVEQAKYVCKKGWPVSWFWNSPLKSFVFIFENHNRIIVERPEYGHAMYFFAIEDDIPIKWQVCRLVAVMGVPNVGRLSLLENAPIMVGAEATAEDGKVLEKYGWAPNTGLGSLLNFCDRLIHHEKKAFGSDPSALGQRIGEWKNRIGKLLMDGADLGRRSKWGVICGR